MEGFTAQQRKWQLFTDFEYNSTTLLQKYIVNSVFSSFGEKLILSLNSPIAVIHNRVAEDTSFFLYNLI